LLPPFLFEMVKVHFAMAFCWLEIFLPILVAATISWWSWTVTCIYLKFSNLHKCCEWMLAIILWVWCVTQRKKRSGAGSQKNVLVLICTILHDIWLHFVTKVRLHAEKLFHKRRCGKVFWHVIERTNLANFCAIAMTSCQWIICIVIVSMQMEVDLTGDQKVITIFAFEKHHR
jgi:hypothetical protein